MKVFPTPFRIDLDWHGIGFVVDGTDHGKKKGFFNPASGNAEPPSHEVDIQNVYVIGRTQHMHSVPTPDNDNFYLRVVEKLEEKLEDE